LAPGEESKEPMLVDPVTDQDNENPFATFRFDEILEEEIKEEVKEEAV
jgi:hypothetical protein